MSRRLDDYATNARIIKAMYEQDEVTLDALTRCLCCCKEHTFEDCPARVVGRCRSGLGLPLSALKVKP